MSILVPVNGSGNIGNLGSGGTMPVPSGVQVGDLVIISLASGSALGTVTLPLGWSGTSLGGVSNTSIFVQSFWHIVTATDGAGWIFSWVNNSIQSQAVIRAYRGNDQVTPLDVAWTTTSGSTTPETAPAITTVTAAGLVESNLISVNNIHWTAPSTTPVTQLYLSTGGGDDVFYENGLSAGTLAARTFTPSATSGRWIGTSIAVRSSSNTAHTGLTGKGSISVTNPVAVTVSISGITAGTPRTKGNPDRFFNLGEISFATNNGPTRQHYIQMQTELVISPMNDCTTIYYSFAPGFTGTITELSAP